MFRISTKDFGLLTFPSLVPIPSDHPRDRLTPPLAIPLLLPQNDLDDCVDRAHGALVV